MHNKKNNFQILDESDFIVKFFFGDFVDFKRELRVDSMMHKKNRATAGQVFAGLAFDEKRERRYMDLGTKGNPHSHTCTHFFSSFA